MVRIADEPTRIGSGRSPPPRPHADYLFFKRPWEQMLLWLCDKRTICMSVRGLIVCLYVCQWDKSERTRAFRVICLCRGGLASPWPLQTPSLFINGISSSPRWLGFIFGLWFIDLLKRLSFSCTFFFFCFFFPVTHPLLSRLVRKFASERLCLPCQGKLSELVKFSSIFFHLPNLTVYWTW